MGIIVLKFGGTSLGSVERIKKAAERIKGEIANGNQPVAVVSAMDHSTDHLVGMAHQMTANPDPRELDMLLATGEQVSMSLLAMALQEMRVGAVSLTGWQAGILTDNSHTEARIISIKKETMLTHVEQGKVVIVAGFQGVTDDGQITTIGRGGSDTTAVTIAAALKADRCDIFTDVDGVFTTDPRLVPHAQLLTSISYDDMLELADLGANVLHPRAVQCAKKYGVSLTVRSGLSDAPGTLIRASIPSETCYEVSGVALMENVAKMMLVGLADNPSVVAKLETILSDCSIPYHDLIEQGSRQGSREIVFSVRSEHVIRVQELLHANQSCLHFDRFLCEHDLAKVSLVGSGITSNSQIVSEVLQRLGEKNIDIKMVVPSEKGVSIFVSQSVMINALRTVHSACGLNRINEPALT